VTLNTRTRLVSDVGVAVRRQFGDESGVQITDADILRWVNDGQNEINLKNKVLKAIATTNIVASQSLYSIPVEDTVNIESIHFNGVPLRSMSYVEAEQYILLNPANDTFAGDSLIWYEYAGSINLWPIPQSNVTNGLTILIIKAPAQVTMLSDTLQLPDKYFNSLVTYVLQQAYEMDEDWDASSFKSQQFEKGVGELSDEGGDGTLSYPVIGLVSDY
jgi:hypothetical protein